MTTPLRQLKQKMINDVTRLTLPQRKRIMYYIMSQGGTLIPSGDGSRINLDRLSEATVRDISYQVERLLYVKPADRVI